MKPATLAEHLQFLWEASGMSLAEIADAAGMSRATVWKAARGIRGPRGHTLAAILRDGFGLSEDDPEYKTAITLWARRQTGRRRAAPDVSASRLSRVHRLVDALDAGQLADVERILRSKHLLHAVASLVDAKSVRS